MSNVTKDQKHTVAIAEGRGCRNSRHGPTFQSWNLKHLYQSIKFRLLEQTFSHFFGYIFKWRSYMRGSWVGHLLMKSHNVVRILKAIYHNDRIHKLYHIISSSSQYMVNSNSTWQKRKCWWRWQERWWWRWQLEAAHGVWRLGERQISFSLYFQTLCVCASCSSLKDFLHFGSKRILLDFRNMISIAEFVLAQ